MTPSTDVFTELAALFLTDAVDPSRPGGAGSAATMAPDVEVLIAGHLPVRGSIWAGGYADALARRRGPVAVVRLDAGASSVEVFRGPSEMLMDEAAPSLRAVARRVGGTVATWIIRPAAGTAIPEMLQALAGIDAGSHAARGRMTILTGCDEAATVALYQTIKQLYEASLSAGAALPPIALAVVGSDDARARALLVRINRTTAAFLGVPVELAASVPRIDAAMRSTWRQPIAAEPSPTLAESVTAIVEAPTTNVSPSHGAARQTAVPPRPAPPVMARGAPAAATPPEPHRNGHGRAVDSPSAAATHGAAAPAKIPPKPALRQRSSAQVLAQSEPAAPPATPSAQAPVSPASLVERLQGLVALPARCPGHETIEVALDDSGRLHVVGRVEQLRQMLIAQRWAAEHAKLLAMTCPARRVDVDASVLIEVVTDRPLDVADLYGSGMGLHVVAPVQVADGTAWFSAPLNRPAASASNR